MSYRRSLRHGLWVASPALIVVLAFLSSACEGTLSPSEAVAASGETFAEAKEANSVTVWTEAATKSDDFEIRYRGVSAYATDGIIYADDRFEVEAPGTTEESRVIVVNGDLYMTYMGEWFVLSPWHQGTRPEEIPDLGINSLLSDYERLAGELEGVQEHSSEEIEAVRYRRYSGELDWESFAGEDDSLALSGAFDVDLWVSDETGLPFRMDYEAELARSPMPQLTLTGTQTFGYDLDMSPPDPPDDAKPWRDLAYPEAPCTAEAFEGCLEAQTELTPVSVDSCGGEGRRICFVPIGNISADLVIRLVEHYRTEYGLDIQVMTPLAAPGVAAVPERNQIDAAGLLEETVGMRWPDEYADADAVIIGITPIDTYNSESHFRYVFGVKGAYSFPKAIVSMFRMTPEFYGDAPDPELTFERTQKLLGKYIGMLYYGLPTSSDPTSQMFDNILGPDDLDRMSDRLPIDAP